jgi:hypothetical protein
MKTKIISKKIAYQVGIVIIGLAVGTMLQFAGAWVNPTVSPPDGNIGAPINTGVATQYKSGALGVGGLLQSDTDVKGTRLCIGNDCRNAWPSSGENQWTSQSGSCYTQNRSGNGDQWVTCAAGYAVAGVYYEDSVGIRAGRISCCKLK